jgi:anti-anti-sigma factor
MELRYQIEQLHDVAVVRCSGRMVRGSALEDFRSRLEQLEHARVLVLDLSELDQIDAGGLGVLLQLRRWSRQHSIQMKLVNPSPFVRRILEATRLMAVFEISSLEEALCILRTADHPPRYAVA